MSSFSAFFHGPGPPRRAIDSPRATPYPGSVKTKRPVSPPIMKTPKPQNSQSWRGSYYHKLFGLKAAHEAGRVLKYFEAERPRDRRPRAAIDAIRAWAQGQRTLGMKAVRKLSLDAHAAARDVKSDAAKFAAHAAGQAVGSWHAPAHALGAFGYAGRAFIAGKQKKTTS